MLRKWEQLTPAEKVEDLRRDLLKTRVVVNDMGHRLNALEGGISEVAGRAHNLESQVARLEAGQGKKGA